MRKAIRDGVELTFHGSDLVSVIDVETGKHIPWNGTIGHDALAQSAMLEFVAFNNRMEKERSE